MNIKIVSVGKLKKGYIREGVSDFCLRLSKYVLLEIIEVKDEKTYDKMSLSEEMSLKKKEGQRILAHIDEKSYVVCLDMRGKHLTSEEFAGLFESKKMERVKELVFVIGGSIGLCQEVLKRADFVLAFSKMTLPHGLMRVVLLEQIYRACRILSGEPYHK